MGRGGWCPSVRRVRAWGSGSNFGIFWHWAVPFRSVPRRVVKLAVPHDYSVPKEGLWGRNLKAC